MGVSKKSVAVTQRVDVIAGRNETRDALDQNLISWIIQAGYTPFPVPNTLGDTSTIRSWVAELDPLGVILSGGNSIGESLHRDLTETTILSWASENEIPILGICRGMQMMATWAGGTIEDCSGHVRTRHTLTVLEESGEWPTTVNSYHDQRVAICPKDFVVTAQSDDGSIEAMRHATLPWEAWMWHPEREDEFSTQDTRRLDRLFNG